MSHRNVAAQVATVIGVKTHNRRLRIVKSLSWHEAVCLANIMPVEHAEC